MSGINVEYNCEQKIGNGANQMQCEGDSNLATIIAGEIVNEILENALNIVTRMTEKVSGQLQIKSIAPALTKHTASTIEEQQIRVSNMCARIVENLVEDASGSCRVQMAPQRHVIADVRSDVANETKRPLCDKGGIRDQSFVLDAKHQVAKVSMEVAKEYLGTVEKKVRVTDLVQNSKPLFSEHDRPVKLLKQQEKLEETEERFLQVIELDCVKPGEVPFRAAVKVAPENVPLPNDDDDIDDVKKDVKDVNMAEPGPQDGADTNPFGKEQRAMEVVHNNGKGDDLVTEKEGAAVAIELDKVAKISEVACSTKSAKKKKWNLGGRLFGFLKKHPKRPQTAKVADN